MDGWNALGPEIISRSSITYITGAGREQKSETMEVLIILAVICAIAGFFVDGGRGAALGGLFGVIGLVICAILRNADAKKV